MTEVIGKRLRTKPDGSVPVALVPCAGSAGPTRRTASPTAPPRVATQRDRTATG
jgi:hypothetical protein